MTKYYRVIKDNFLWDVGAILKKDNDEKGYTPIDEIFCKLERNILEYITADIIEDSSEYFERVYGVNLLTKTVFKTKEEAKEILKEINKGI